MPAPDWTLLLRTPAFEVTALLLGLVVGSFVAMALVTALLVLSLIDLDHRSLFVG